MVVDRKPWSTQGTGPAAVDGATLHRMAHVKGLAEYMVGRMTRGIPSVGTIPGDD